METKIEKNNEAKLEWITPKLEIISENQIKSGAIPGPPEGGDTLYAGVS
ncbi:hypothetical protein [Sediminibacterium sp.]